MAQLWCLIFNLFENIVLYWTFEESFDADKKAQNYAQMLHMCVRVHIVVFGRKRASLDRRFELHVSDSLSPTRSGNCGK